MMTAKWITKIDGSLVRIWEPAYREDVVLASEDHPYGTCGSTAGHECHWEAPYPPSATAQKPSATAGQKWTPQSLESKEAA